MKNMVTTRWNPKLYAFGQARIGRPGYNFLSNDFVFMWIFGVRFSWNFFNGNQYKNEKKIFDINGDIIRARNDGSFNTGMPGEI